MTDTTTKDAIRVAIEHHNVGRLAEAERIYRQVLAAQPANSDALNLLGLIAHQVGQSAAAVNLIRQAIAISPEDASYHSNLGNALKDLGRFDESVEMLSRAAQLQPEMAEIHNNLGSALKAKGRIEDAVTAYRRAIQLKPEYAEAYSNLGSALKEQGKIEDAMSAYRRAIELKPDVGGLYYNLANSLKGLGKLDEAINAYSRAIEIAPDLAVAYNNMGICLRDLGKLEEAIRAYRHAIALREDYADAYCNLGNALIDAGEPVQAVAACTKAVQLNPRAAKAHNNLGNALMEIGKLDQAAAEYLIAINIKPDYANAYNNLGNLRKDQGSIDDAIASYDRAIALDPRNAAIGSNRLFTLHFHPEFDAKSIFEEHERWNQQHAGALQRLIESHRNSPQPHRRLRIGYISGDLRIHPVARFLLGFMECRNRDASELFLYSDVRAPDGITARFQGICDTWRSIVGIPDEFVAQLIRADEIDILVDLSMHSAHNRMLVCARKPAPIQVTYLAYCSTTGMRAIDYRFTDPYLDPPELGDLHYSEKSIRLPETYWCYEAGISTPKPGHLPAATSGRITFGCLNNFAKVSPAVIDAWSEILLRAPRSGLILHSKEGTHRRRITERMLRSGIEPDRIKFVGHLPEPEYFLKYHEIDICLDPFPCNGGTTTCDSLWMGVPVVTRAGRTAVGRAGVSILSNVGLADLIAYSHEQYVQLALGLSRDLPRLVSIRSQLRDHIRASPLMNATQFARHIEAAYREMWIRWCAVANRSSFSIITAGDQNER